MSYHFPSQGSSCFQKSLYEKPEIRTAGVILANSRTSQKISARGINHVKEKREDFVIYRNLNSGFV